MGQENKIKITVQTTVSAPVEKVWEKWTNPDDIIKWNTASEDWHTTKAENDLRAGGKFSSRMEAKDGSVGFDFWGIYDNIKNNELIEYTMGDGRKVTVSFTSDNNKTEIVETFEAEDENSEELQKTGWQSIMDSFRKYVESE
ncbi:MAG: SRPBCC family protein [Ignavibacteria bacterium]|jgi:uncharacterized protein YndB with AHSA1/START domain|nr:SRPBCC family protein [Ignavibacteria bacterium]